jgi:hypothetical protein
MSNRLVSGKVFHASVPTRAALMMLDAASHFVACLTPEQQSRVLFPFQNEKRINWDYRPRADGPGLPLNEMDSSQQKFALALRTK